MTSFHMNEASTYHPPSDTEIIDLYRESRRIAVVGLSPRPYRPSYFVAARMREFGFDIIPVNPMVAEISGVKVYASLRELPFPVELVNVFRAAQHVADIVDQCMDRKVMAIWLQEGVVDVDSATRAHNAGILTVMDRCIYKEYVRLMKPHR